VDPNDPNGIAKHYLKQLCGDRVPTLADWQKLIDMKLPNSEQWLHVPIGRGHFVMAMCLDQQNNLWVGEEAGDNSGGLYRFSLADGMWRHFTAKDGLGDDSIYALACDQQGRVWIGHLNHGVTVFNGEKFQNYEVVGGLSRPDTLNGPLGERIFKIAVAPEYGAQGGNPGPTFRDPLTDKESPMAGSVWMASSAGLAIYFPATDTWSYLTRAEGLPSDQANAIAFDGQGRVYVGTQCDGIAMAGPVDHYATWKQVTAANSTPHAVDGKIVDVPVPTVGKGQGLPTDLINDLLVAKDGTVYAATTLGLAWSVDRGNTWQFVRGADWVDKVKNRFGGPPVGWVAPSDAARGGGMLAEDYVTALAEDGEGNILVGHRAVTGDILAAKAARELGSSDNLYVTSFAIDPGNKGAFRGTYGHGMSVHAMDKYIVVPQFARAPNLGALPKKPSGAATRNTAQLAQQLQAFVAAPPRLDDKPGTIAVLSDDFSTQGTWINHYGWYASLGCAQNGSYDFLSGYRGAWFSCRSYIGRNNRDDVLRRWVDPVQNGDPRVLQHLLMGGRKLSSWDDHGEDYPTSWSGPDIYCTVKLPKGVYIVSLYFLNYRAHQNDFPYARRDFGVECRYTPMNEEDYGQLEKTGAGEELFNSAPLRARSRVSYFREGVYKRFYANVDAPGFITVKVSRFFSINATLSGIFVDPAGPLCGAGGPEVDPVKPWVPHVPPESDGGALVWAKMAEQMLIYRDGHSLAYFTDGRRLQMELLRGALASSSGDLEKCQAGDAVRQMPELRQVFAECARDQRLFALFDRIYLDDEYAELYRWEALAKQEKFDIHVRGTLPMLTKFRQEKESKFLWRPEATE
jgi:hypothetical protein